MMGELEEIFDFFKDCGGTDFDYLRHHYCRFKNTSSFALQNSDPLIILDLGAHWLHLAYFFKDKGHTIICGDTSNTFELPCVIEAAKKMKIELMPYKRLDLGNGINAMPDNSVDLVLFSEIIEHLAFNPLVFWKEIYRVLKDGGRIVITTPNSCYWRSVVRVQTDLVSAKIGLSINEIFDTGTYGHHWKEYSIFELRDYFAKMNCGFNISRYEILSDGSSLLDEKNSFLKYTRAHQSKFFDLLEIVNSLENSGAYPYGSQIFSEVILYKKNGSFDLNPPWYVD